MLSKRAGAAFTAMVVVAASGCSAAMSGGESQDGVVAHIFMTSNTGEIQTSQVATSRAQSAAVRDFAQRMITEHSAANDRLTNVTRDEGIAPAPNPASAALQQTAQQTVSALNTYTGAAFDRVYMENQVALHQYTLRTLDEHLIPAARNDDLESLLVSTRPAVAQHLQMAQQILGGLPR